MTYKRKVQIGDCTLYHGDCLEVMPTLDKVDAVVACCDAVVYTNKHGKTAKWKPETQADCSVNMGEPQGGNNRTLHKRQNVSGATSGALCNVSTGNCASIEKDGDRVEIKGQKREPERTVYRRGAKHDLPNDGRKNTLQQMRGKKPVTCASCGRGSHEQRGRKFGSPVQSVSHKPPQARMVGQEKISVLTDPPYGIDYGGLLKGKGNGRGGSDKNGWKSYDAPEWDKERPTRHVFDLILSVSNYQIIWGGNYFTDYLPPTMQWLVWDKGQRDFSLADCEFAWSDQHRAARIFEYPRAKALQDGKQHPTQKPVALMKWCLGFLPDTETILDPFMGSGTTGVACAKLGRKFIGIELDEDYFEIACERIRKAYEQPDLFIEAPIKIKQQDIFEELFT